MRSELQLSVNRDAATPSCEVFTYLRTP